jgi:hypothetical protein
MQTIMKRLKLTVNPSKTQVCRLPEDTVDFLGYTIGRCWRPRGGTCYVGTKPAATRIARIKRAITEATSRRWTLKSEEERVETLNRMLRGWSNYFCLGAVTPSYRAIDYHARERLREWLCRKHAVDTRGSLRFTDQHLYDKLGLVKLCAKTRSLPWAKA